MGVEVFEMIGAGIGAGGDLALIAIAHAIWKIDRRVLKLELVAES
jgi:hypothetical protein